MNLQFFNHVFSTISSNKHLKAYKWKLTIYRHFDESWYLTNSATKQDSETLIKLLQDVRKSKTIKQIGLTRYFYSEIIDSVICFTTPKRTLTKTTANYLNLVHETIEHSEHSFNANHDILTGLLNRAGAEKEIFKLITQPKLSLESSESESIGVDPYCGLITFDIDYFKQVNDTHGHAYGDAVLKAFAWRLNEQISILENQSTLTLVLSRPGGEEFELFASNIELDALINIAEIFRKAIEENPLPDDTQLNVIAKDLGIDSSKCPKIQGRNIRASVGISHGKSSGNSKEFYSKLKAEADAALYRAKSDGRNCCRSFKDIKLLHGKVLEHVDSSSIVIIDIGSAVKVNVGDVFRVYPPNFSGKTPFVVSDQRSSKEMGYFPKLSSGEVVVFEVQANISICHIISVNINAPFAPGSYLEFHTLGLDRPFYDRAPPTIMGYVMRLKEFMESFDTSLKQNSVYCLALFRILPNSPLDKTFNADSYLSEVINLIRVSLPASCSLGYLQSGYIGMYSIENEPNKIVTANHLLEITRTTHKNFKIACGTILSAYDAFGFDDDEVELIDIKEILPRSELLSSLDLLHISRLLVYIAVHSKKYKGLAKYEESMIDHFIWLLRDTGLQFDEIIYEYHKLLNLGFDSWSMHNLMGLSIFSSKHIDLLPTAEKMFVRANTLNTTNEFVVLNLAICRTKLGKHQEAYEGYKKHSKTIDKQGVSNIYSLSRAKSCLEIAKLTKSKIQKNKLLEFYSKALSQSSPKSGIYLDWYREIRIEFNKLSEH